MHSNMESLTKSVNKGRATDFIYLDFSILLDKVPHIILHSKLKRDGFTNGGPLGQSGTGGTVTSRE